MAEPWELDVLGGRAALDQGELSALDLLTSCLRRTDEIEPDVHAFEYLDTALAASNARSAPDGPLHGIPTGIKDIFNTADMPTTMGSPLWASFTPGNDARVVHYVRMAGGVVMGKTITAEFAIHAPGETRNPHRLSRSPGTSSSGSAAAVASGMVPWALGSQTAGSVVRPASYCGVFGYKPSFGLLPRTGMLKTTDTLDSIGYFTRSPHDLRPILDVLRVSGPDYPLVHSTLDRADPDGQSAPTRIGLVTDSLPSWEHVSGQAAAELDRFATELGDAGIRIEPTKAPGQLNRAHEIHKTIYDRCVAYYFKVEAKEGTMLSEQILEMVERGRLITVEEYTSALDAQIELTAAYAQWAADYDAILTLTTSGPAHSIEEVDGVDSALTWTLCGAPAVSLPVLTHDPGGLPLGAQLVGRRFADHHLLSVIEDLADKGLVPAIEPVTPAEEEPGQPATGTTAGS